MKCVYLRQNSQNWSKWAKTDQKFAFSMLNKRYTSSKKVHFCRLWRLWLIWAMVFPSTSLVQCKVQLRDNFYLLDWKVWKWLQCQQRAYICIRRNWGIENINKGHAHHHHGMLEENTELRILTRATPTPHILELSSITMLSPPPPCCM